MIVYRLEKDGRGPYNYHLFNHGYNTTLSKLCADLNAEHTGCPDHPSWATDFKDDDTPIYRSEYKSGCRSIESLTNWFGDFLVPLMDFGFCVAKYRGKDVVESERQVAFIPARRIALFTKYQVMQKI